MAGTSSARQSPPTVLVAEDNYLTAKSLCEIVRECGFSVAGPAARVDRGLDLLSERHVDAALVDIALDGTESYPLCAALDQRKVPFAFVTAYPSSAIPAAFRAAPLLSKPVDPAQIRTTLGDFSLAPVKRRTDVRNFVLDGMDPDDRERLAPLLESVPLEAGQLLEKVGEPPAHVVFPTQGVISMRTQRQEYAIEAALVGREGMIGIGGMMNAGSSIFEARVHVPGRALRLPMRELLAHLVENRRLQGHLLTCAYGFLEQMAQAVLASSLGTIEERLARWLLMMNDRLDEEEIYMTHEGMAQVLGVRRAGVTVALHVLEGKHAIRSDRKRVRIVDRSMLCLVAGPFYEDQVPK